MNENLNDNSLEDLVLLFACVAEKSYGHDLNKEAMRMKWLATIQQVYKRKKAINERTK